MKNKTALVIGGSGGIGASISLMLSQICSKIYIHGGHKSQKFDDLVTKIENENCKVEKIIYDFSKYDFLDIEKSELSKITEKIDILCVCHAPFFQKKLEEMTISDWKLVSLYDFALPGYFVSKVLPNMKKKHFGRIILFGGTGTSHRTEYKTNVAYASAKSALNILVESTAAAYSKDGITCNAILPGFVQTEYNKNSSFPENMEIQIEKIQKSVKFLIENSELNGVLLRIDKGWSPLF